MARVLVTGANRGIGLALCRGFLNRGYEVIGTSRQTSSELEAMGVQVEALDVSDPLSIQALSNRLEDTPIDVVVNNAGILSRDDLDSLDFDAGAGTQNLSTYVRDTTTTYCYTWATTGRMLTQVAAVSGSCP